VRNFLLSCVFFEGLDFAAQEVKFHHHFASHFFSLTHGNGASTTFCTCFTRALHWSGPNARNLAKKQQHTHTQKQLLCTRVCRRLHTRSGAQNNKPAGCVLAIYMCRTLEKQADRFISIVIKWCAHTVSREKKHAGSFACARRYPL